MPFAAGYWPDQYQERNHAVANQRLSDSNDTWKKESGLSPPLSGRNGHVPVQNVSGGHLSLHNYDAQVGEAMAMVKALNRITLLGMLNSIRIT